MKGCAGCSTAAIGSKIQTASMQGIVSMQGIARMHSRMHGIAFLRGISEIVSMIETHGNHAGNCKHRVIASINARICT